MKKIIYMLVFILITHITNGSQAIITKVDFSQQLNQAYILGDGDGISFLVNDKEYYSKA